MVAAQLIVGVAAEARATVATEAAQMPAAANMVAMMRGAIVAGETLPPAGRPAGINRTETLRTQALCQRDMAPQRVLLAHVAYSVGSFLSK